MKRVVCSVLDTASGLYGQPFFAPAVGVAVRGFTDEVNRRAEPEQNPLYHHPADFQLWLLAWFDEESGAFVADEGGRRMLCRGQDVSQQEK